LIDPKAIAINCPAISGVFIAKGELQKVALNERPSTLR
jgi:Zn-finger nucleic acid-binding protein